MEDYNKIIESLGIRFMNAKNLVLQQSVNIKNYKDVGNSLVYLHKGAIYYGKENERLEEGNALFIPGGKEINLSFGEGSGEKISNDQFINNLESYFKVNTVINEVGGQQNSYSIISFEAKIFDAVNYFSSLDIPPFVIEQNESILDSVLSLLKEMFIEKVGKERSVRCHTEQLVINVMRYILENQLFLEQLATNTTYFKDPRLIDIFKHIKENLSGDLSNKALANVANVSEDYVGQYFKMLTGINPQDYIEYQRMERAVYLLRTTKRSIREIGKDVGYKDTAYFCRRFKMMFGIPAGKMRRRETLMNM